MENYVTIYISIGILVILSYWMFFYITQKETFTGLFNSFDGIFILVLVTGLVCITYPIFIIGYVILYFITWKSTKYKG